MYNELDFDLDKDYTALLKLSYYVNAVCFVEAY